MRAKSASDVLVAGISRDYVPPVHDFSHDSYMPHIPDVWHAPQNHASYIPPVHDFAHDSVNPSFPSQPSLVGRINSDFWQGVDEINAFGGSFRNSLVNTAAGAANAMSHPINTVENIGGDVEYLYQHPEAITNAEQNFIYGIENANGVQMAGMLGSATANLATAFAGGELVKGIQAMGLGTQLAKGTASALTKVGVFADRTILAVADSIPKIPRFGEAAATQRPYIGAGAFFREPGTTQILASSPSEIAWGYGELSTRQANVLETLNKPGLSTQLYKSDINVTDLAALTAKTGDEFAMFTLGSQRIVIRGNNIGLNISNSLTEKLLTQGYRWSAHTHPGFSDRVLMASGNPGDRQVLEMFNQDRSLIINSVGRRSIFELENDYLITNQTNYDSPKLRW